MNHDVFVQTWLVVHNAKVNITNQIDPGATHDEYVASYVCGTLINQVGDLASSPRRNTVASEGMSMVLADTSRSKMYFKRYPISVKANRKKSFLSLS